MGKEKGSEKNGLSNFKYLHFLKNLDLLGGGVQKLNFLEYSFSYSLIVITPLLNMSSNLSRTTATLSQFLPPWKVVTNFQSKSLGKSMKAFTGRNKFGSVYFYKNLEF